MNKTEKQQKPLRKITKEQSQSTKTEKVNFNTVSQKLQEITDISLKNTYHNIVDTSLKKFITCLVDNKLSVLHRNKQKKATEEQLKAAWINLQEEYIEAIADDTYKQYMRLELDCVLLQGKLDCVHTLADLMRKMPDPTQYPDACKMLNKYCNSNFTFQDKKEIDACTDRVRHLKINLELKKVKLAALESRLKSSKKDKIDKTSFYKTLIDLSDHAKMKIDDSITVFEYCHRIKTVKQWQEKLKK